MSKRGFLFTIDAFLAAVLLISGLILITDTLVSVDDAEQTSVLSQDVMTALSTIAVGELNNSWVEEQIALGAISDPSLPLIVQIGTFWAQNQTEQAENLTEILLEDLIPDEFAVELMIEDDTLYSRSGTANMDRRAVATRRMVTGIQKGAALTGSTSFAYLKSIRAKSTKRYAYFGGFVGQGNITVRLDSLPDDINETNIQEMYLEGDFDSDFLLLINDNFCGGTYDGLAVDTVQYFNVTSCANLIEPGNNTVTLKFMQGLTNASISGGLLMVSYTTTEIEETLPDEQKLTYFPQIDGVINLYDGFSTPGTITNMTVHLHYWVEGNSTLPIYFDIGNTTIYQSNVTGTREYTVPDAYLRLVLNYSEMNETTVPFRFGFYDGNATNSSGNISDVFLLTSRHHSMSTEDIFVNESTNISRMEQAKNVDDLFVDIMLNASGNRVGLVSFGTGASVDLDNVLTDDAVELHSDISGYAPHPTDAQRYLCGAMEESKFQLAAAGSSRKKAILLMTDGDLLKTSGNTARCSGGPTKDRGEIWADAVAQACDFDDPVHGNPENVTFYTVAFGPNATSDPLIVGNLTLMANCTGGQFAAGNNASELQEIYTLFAAEMAASSVVFTFQRATVASDVDSLLYADSFINVTFVPSTPQAGTRQIPVTFQTGQFGGCTPTVTIDSGLTVIDAALTSYSGDYWTRLVSVDGTNIYNLSSYGNDFAAFGDPFLIHVPQQLLNGGVHTFDLSIGANATEDKGCSVNNTLIYTALVNASTSRSGILPLTVGCNWQIEFEDGSFLNVSVPSDYTGQNNCTYTSSGISYNTQDAYDVAVADLLDKIDFDDDGRVFLNLESADLEIVVSLVSQVPYLWGPTMAKVVVTR